MYDTGSSSASILPRGCSRRRVLGRGAVLAALWLAGCKSDPADGGRTGGVGGSGGVSVRPAEGSGGGSSKVAPVGNNDPCAVQLQDKVCGALIGYFARHQELPDRLDQLIGINDVQSASDLVCPVSKERYTYYRTGILILKTTPPSRVILYDPQPSHAGFRWGITFNQTSGPKGMNVVLNVIPLEESLFELNIGK
jgi:hypothetical protein